MTDKEKQMTGKRAMNRSVTVREHAGNCKREAENLAGGWTPSHTNLALNSR